MIFQVEMNFLSSLCSVHVYTVCGTLGSANDLFVYDVLCPRAVWKPVQCKAYVLWMGVLGIEELITYDRYANQPPPPWPLSPCVPCCHSHSLSLLLTLARSRYLPARLLHVERADEASEPARGFAPLACFTRKVLVARSMSVRSRERTGLLQALTLARQTISLNCGSCQWCETATTFLFVPVSTILNAYNSF
jgi:hypothetical protein